MDRAVLETPGNDVASCPAHAGRTPRVGLSAADELVFPKHKRFVASYAINDEGHRELQLHYGETQIVFDEPELFAFGEGLAKHSRFTAGSATTWGTGYPWPRVRELLEELIDEEILQREAADGELPGDHRAVPSPLPPAGTKSPRTWFECEAIMQELTGRPLELGYLELVVPIYRVAHIAIDAEGRQVGEANVFPAQLRVDVPTEWRACHSPGSRYRDDLPMNITALKSMVKHWKASMIALTRIREAYLERFPQAREQWTVGDVQRLSSVVLSLPAYLLMRSPSTPNGELHPVFSSLYRVTDGARMTMHRMLFTSNGEPARPADSPITAAEAYAYAERNTAFLSDHGVCAGPRAMIEEFLRVLIDGEAVKDAESVALDEPVRAALDDLARVFEYGLHGLRAYAVAFSLWPRMCSTYEQLLESLETAARLPAPLRALRDRLRPAVHFIRAATRLATPAKRAMHEAAYADMYAQCTRGLGGPGAGDSLGQRLASGAQRAEADFGPRLRDALRECCGPLDSEGFDVDSFFDVLNEYFAHERAVVCAAADIQSRINEVLGRAAPRHPLSAADLALHYRLVASEYQPEQLREIGGRLPYLPHDLEAQLGLRVMVTPDTIEISTSNGSAG